MSHLTWLSMMMDHTLCSFVRCFEMSQRKTHAQDHCICCFGGKICIETGGICFMKQPHFYCQHTLLSLLLWIAGRTLLLQAWTCSSLASPQTNWGIKEKNVLQFFQNVSTFKSLWHSQTGFFAIAWQLYLFLDLSNTLQKAARDAIKPRLLYITFIKKQHFNCHDFSAFKMGGVTLEIFPGTVSTEI